MIHNQQDVFSSFSEEKLLTVGKNVIKAEVAALDKLMLSFPNNFIQAVSALKNISGKIVCTGLGKSGHIARKISAILSFTGSPSFFLYPTEALHGDLGALASGDALLIFSNMGETLELLHLIKRAHAKICVLITSRKNSALASYANIILELPETPEAPPFEFVPTASSIMMMALGDALAITISQEKNIKKESSHALHPAGAIGKQLSPVSKFMRPAPLLPIGSSSEKIMLTMACTKLGCLGLMDHNEKLCQIIYAHPLMNFMFYDATHETCLSIGPDMSVVEALALMDKNNLEALFVVNEHRKAQGVFCKEDGLRASHEF